MRFTMNGKDNEEKKIRQDRAENVRSGLLFAWLCFNFFFLILQTTRDCPVKQNPAFPTRSSANKQLPATNP